MNSNDNLKLSDATICELVKRKTIFILRGLPGSGKSTLANQLTEKIPNLIICSADDFFLNTSGEYEFNAEKRGEAHKVCQEKAKKACIDSRNIVIDNTNIRKWETKYYFDLAKEFDYLTILLEPETEWKRDADALSKKNKHHVRIIGIRIKIRFYR